MSNLRPSLDVACSVLGEEIAALQAAGERVTSLHHSIHVFADDGCVHMSTDSDHDHAVTIFGFTDEDDR